MNWLRIRVQLWLGISGIQNQLYWLDNTYDRQLGLLNQKLDKLRVDSLGIGRIIAKLDPGYTQSEFDPERKAASDKLANEVLSRLGAEQAVRDHYHYTPNKD